MEQVAKALYVFTYVLLCGAAVYTLWQGNWANLFIIGLALLISFTPSYVERQYGVTIGYRTRFGIALFLFCTLVLGEIAQFYTRYLWWDTVLHGFAGFGLTLFGFVILTKIYVAKDLHNTPFLTSLFALSFTGFMAVLWEVYEFCIDSLGWSENTMQPGLRDTMIDLVVAVAGGTVVVVFGYRYLKMKERNFASEVMQESEV